MLTFGVYPIENFGMLDAVVVSVLAIVIVFAVLALIIGATTGIEKINSEINYRTKINPSPENSVLEDDKDAVVATLVATIDYHREFNSDCKVVSVEKVEE